MDGFASELHRRGERVHRDQGGASWTTNVGQGVATVWLLPRDRHARGERPLGPGPNRSKGQSAGGLAVEAHALCRRPSRRAPRHRKALLQPRGFRAALVHCAHHVVG